MTYLLFSVGIIALFLGGEALVRGASGIATRFRVPPLVIGLTVVGFGTSTPELLVSLQAALKGSSGIAIGNVVGSNTANILLIIGLAAVIGPIAAPFAKLRRDLAWMLAAALVCVPLFWNDRVSHLEGALLVAAIVAYVVISLRQAGTTDEEAETAGPLWLSGLTTIAGLVVLMAGARLLVDSSTVIARAFGVSEAVIGLTIVAVGTSLPELATSVIAALRGHREIALGNAIGSNVFNIFAILGLTALVTPIPVEERFLTIDVPFMIAVSGALVAVIWFRGGLGRATGVAFLLAYAAYVAAMAAL